MSVHKGEDILSAGQRWRNRTTSTCEHKRTQNRLRFPVEKTRRRKQGTAALAHCKGRARLRHGARGFGAKRVKQRTTWAHQLQRAAASHHAGNNKLPQKQRVLWSATSWYDLVWWAYAPSPRNDSTEIEMQCSRKTTSLGENQPFLGCRTV